MCQLRKLPECPEVRTSIEKNLFGSVFFLPLTGLCRWMGTSFLISLDPRAARHWQILNRSNTAMEYPTAPSDGTPSFLLPPFVPLTPVLPITIGIPKGDDRQLCLQWRHSSPASAPALGYPFVRNDPRDTSSVSASNTNNNTTTTTTTSSSSEEFVPASECLTPYVGCADDSLPLSSIMVIDGDDVDGRRCHIGPDNCLLCRGFTPVYLIPGANNSIW